MDNAPAVCPDSQLEAEQVVTDESGESIQIVRSCEEISRFVEQAKAPYLDRAAFNRRMRRLNQRLDEHAALLRERL